MSDIVAACYVCRAPHHIVPIFHKGLIHKLSVCTFSPEHSIGGKMLELTQAVLWDRNFREVHERIADKP